MTAFVASISDSRFRVIMRFRLVYSGSLRSAGNRSRPEDARDIRDTFHDQLTYLWKTHRALEQLRWAARVPGPEQWGGFLGLSPSPFRPKGPPTYPPQDGFVDLSAPLSVNGKPATPLVRKSLDLTCSLDILFLRKEDPGALVMQGGDLDGRIKILFDALRMPTPEEERQYPSRHSEIFCLMESDTLVSRFDVETDRLLMPTTNKPHEVQLVIQVSIEVLVVGEWNVCLVGG